MTETKHTPGPWHIEQGKGPMRIATLGGRIASIADFAPRNDQRIAVANARLIAAAPETAAERDRLREVNRELVEALERALVIRSPNVKWTKAETVRSWEAWDGQVRAALARAKGE